MFNLEEWGDYLALIDSKSIVIAGKSIICQDASFGEIMKSEFSSCSVTTESN